MKFSRFARRLTSWSLGYNLCALVAIRSAVAGVLATTLVNAASGERQPVLANDLVIDREFVLARSDIHTPGGVAVDVSASRVYVSDSRNHALVSLSMDGTKREMVGVFGSDSLAFYEPGAVDVDASGRIYVSDFGNRRIQVLNQSFEYLTEIRLRHYVRDMAVSPDGQNVYVPADHMRSDALVLAIDVASGDTTRIGSIESDGEGLSHVRDALNRIRIDVFANGDILVAFQTLAFVRVFDSSGLLLSDFDVRSDRLDACRRHWFEQRKSELEKAGRAFVTDPSRSDLVEDIVAVCQDGRSHGVELLADITAADESVVVLSCGDAYFFDSAGVHIRTVDVGGTPDARVLRCYGLEVASGQIYAWDPFHERRVYRLNRKGGLQ